MCNSYYPIDELIDMMFSSNTYGDLRESMLIRKRQLDEKIKNTPIHIPTKEEIEKSRKKVEEYAKQCKDSSRVSETSLYRRFTI